MQGAFLRRIQWNIFKYRYWYQTSFSKSFKQNEWHKMSNQCRWWLPDSDSDSISQRKISKSTVYARTLPQAKKKFWSQSNNQPLSESHTRDPCQSPFSELKSEFSKEIPQCSTIDRSRSPFELISLWCSRQVGTSIDKVQGQVSSRVPWLTSRPNNKKIRLERTGVTNRFERGQTFLMLYSSLSLFGFITT